jgi:hypothetical protein
VEEHLPSFMLEVVSSPELVTNLLSSIRPTIVVLEGYEPSREARLLVAKANANSVPIVILGSHSAAEALRWLQEGATDCCSPSELSQTRLETTAANRATLLSRVVVWARLERLSTEFCVLPGTPLEGRVDFHRGELTAATFCRLEGMLALSEILNLPLGALTPA